MQPNETTRVIYAKLTSTGAYDVVGKTRGIELDAARELAERVQPGNIPYDSKLSEGLAYLRPTEGGHLIARYAPYAWRDAHGRESILTDIVKVDDAAFAAVRKNPFALVPRSDAVFDVLTELPAPPLPSVSVEAEQARLAALRSETRGLHTFVAAALAADPLLIVDREGLSANLEALVLMLPPSLRARVTFHSQAFQPAPYQPRITIADAMHPILRNVRWAKVLPDDAGSLLAQPAEQLIELMGNAERLTEAHARYERSGAGSGTLESEVARLVRFAEFGHALRRGLATDALRMTSLAAPTDAPLLFTELESKIGSDELTHAVRALLEDPSGNDAAIARLLTSADARYLNAVADWSAQATRPLAPALVSAILTGLCAANDVDRAVRCCGGHIRALREAAFTPPEQTQKPLRELIAALLDRDRVSAIDRAIRVVLAVTGISSQLKTSTGQHTVATFARDTVEDGVRNLRMSLEDVRAFQRLQTIVDELPKSAWSDPLRAALFTPDYVMTLSAAEVERDAEALAGTLTRDAAGAFAVAAIKNAHDHPKARAALVQAAARILGRCDGQVRERAARTLEQYGITDLTLLDDSVAFEPVLPLLGFAGSDAALAHTLVSGLRKLLIDTPPSASELAGLVLATRTRAGTATLRAGSLPLRAVLDVFRGAKTQGGNERKVALELALELLAFIADANAMREIEAVALNGQDGIEVRLRRLDRAYLQCQTGADEPVYRAVVAALERGSVKLPPEVLHRLKDALGVGGLEYGLVRAITEVFEPRAI